MRGPPVLLHTRSKGRFSSLAAQPGRQERLQNRCIPSESVRNKGNGEAHTLTLTLTLTLTFVGQEGVYTLYTY